MFTGPCIKSESPDLDQERVHTESSRSTAEESDKTGSRRYSADDHSTLAEECTVIITL